MELTFPYRRPSEGWRLLRLLGLVALGAVALLLAAMLLTGGVSIGAGLLPLILAGAFAMRLAQGLRHHPPEQVVVGEMEVGLPASSGASALSYASVRLMWTRPGGMLLTSHESSCFLEATHFCSAEEAERCLGEIQRRVEAVVAPEVLEQAHSDFQEAAGRPTRATNALIAICGLAFVGEWWVGAGSGDWVELARLGAFQRDLVAQGDWYRLVSANYWHGNLLHLVLNMMALESLGGALEKQWGSARFLVLYLGSTIAGALGCTLAPSICVGASTGIYGLLGATVAMHWRGVPAEWRLPRRWFAINLALAVLISLVPGVSWEGHAGGMAGGLALAWILHSQGQRSWPGVAAAGLLLIHAAGLAQALYAFRTLPPRTVVTRLLRASLPPEPINVLSWTLAVDPQASPSELTAALAAMEPLSRDPAAGDTAREAWLDTIATLHYRLGNYQKAATLEACLSPTPFHLSQLARFLQRGLQAGAPIGLPVATLQGDELVGPSRPVIIYLVVDTPAGDLAGLETVFWSPQTSGSYSLARERAHWPTAARARVGYVKEDLKRAPPPGELRASFSPLTPEARGLP